MPINTAQIARQHKSDQKRYNTYSSRRFYRALREMVAPVLTNFDVQVSAIPMYQAYNDVYTFVAIDAAKKEYLGIRKREGTKADIILQLLLNTWNSWIGAYITENLSQMVQDVTQNTQDKINEALSQAREQGLTRRQTAELIYKTTLGEIGRRRAKLIGITESTTAANVGKMKSGKDYGQIVGQEMMKKWIQVKRPTERRTHDYQDELPPIGQDQPFHVIREYGGGVDIMQSPGDLSASASNRCNCACVLIMMTRRFAERNYTL